MKRIIIIALILISAVAKGQIYTNDPSYGKNFNRINAINVLQIPADTVLDGATNPCVQIAKIDNIIYTYNCDSTKWVQISASGGSDSSIVSASSSKYVGLMYDKSNWTDLSDFGSNSLGATISGGKIQIPDAGVTDFTKSLELASYSCINHWKIEIIFKLTTPITGSTTGISIGINGANANSLNSWAVYFSTSTSNTGRMEFFAQSNSGSWFSADAANSNLNFSEGDSIKLSMERVNSNVYLHAENLTDPSQSTSLYSIVTPINADPIPPNTGHFSIFGQGGTFEIERFSVYNNEIKNPDILFLGDSKTLGYGADDFYNTYPGILGTYYKDVSISAGFGDKTSDMLNRLPEIISINPKNVLLSIGSNDQRFGVSDATFQDNYSSIVDQLTAAGIIVSHISPSFETDQDLLSQYEYVKSNYPRVVDVFNIFKDASALYSDGIHWTNKGNKLVSKLVQDSNFISGVKTDQEYIAPVKNVNIYTEDGTLTGTRDVHLADNYLRFVNDGSSYGETALGFNPGQIYITSSAGVGDPNPNYPGSFSISNYSASIGCEGIHNYTSARFDTTQGAIIYSNIKPSFPYAVGYDETIGTDYKGMFYTHYFYIAGQPEPKEVMRIDSFGNVSNIRYKNTVALDSVLSTDVDGNMIMISSDANFIRNQTGTPQTGNLYISGQARSNAVRTENLWVTANSAIIGGISYRIQTVTGNTSLDYTNYSVLVNNSGTATISLPPAIDNPGAVYFIKKISAASNDVVLDGDVSDTVEGSASLSLTLQNSSVMLQSDGVSNWVILASHASATTL